MNSKVLELKKEIGAVKGGITSKTIRTSRASKMILFRFDAGQRLSEHTSSVAATIHIVEGRAKIHLGKRVVDASAGTWIDMEPGLPHALVAKSPLVMLLTLFQHEKRAPARIRA